jgi:quercetin dioxygenase-like cupin family protein
MILILSLKSSGVDGERVMTRLMLSALVVIASIAILSTASRTEEVTRPDLGASKKQQVQGAPQMPRPHQPDEADFRSILPEDIDWKPFPAFPLGALLAILVGHPSEPGPYVVRVKVSGGAKLMPHKHPEDRIYTVISGVLYIGLGEKFDADKMNAYPPGSVVVLPGNTPISTGQNPASTSRRSRRSARLEYLDPQDDPRRHSR